MNEVHHIKTFFKKCVATAYFRCSLKTRFSFAERDTERPGEREGELSPGVLPAVWRFTVAMAPAHERAKTSHATLYLYKKLSCDTKTSKYGLKYFKVQRDIF